jgi:hypothetical protein
MFEDENGVKLFCGDVSAAKNLTTLRRCEIGFVVNCQSVMTENYFEGDDSANIEYLRFPVALFGCSVKARPLSGERLFCSV